MPCLAALLLHRAAVTTTEGQAMIRTKAALLLALLFSVQLPPSAPLQAQPGSDRHVDHEGMPLPAEAIARVGSARLRTDGQPCWLACTPDGKTIISAACNSARINSLQLWDAATGKL